VSIVLGRCPIVLNILKKRTLLRLRAERLNVRIANHLVLGSDVETGRRLGLLDHRRRHHHGIRLHLLAVVWIGIVTRRQRLQSVLVSVIDHAVPEAGSAHDLGRLGAGTAGVIVPVTGTRVLASGAGEFRSVHELEELLGYLWTGLLRGHAEHEDVALG